MRCQPRRLFTEDQIRAISQALGHTEDGLTGAEITDLLHLSKVKDEIPNGTKWKRIYYSLWNKQCEVLNRTNTLQFIRLSIQPARYATQPGRFEPLRLRLNKALAFSGLQATEGGELSGSERVSTLPEAEQRAQNLRASLEARGVHPDVLRFCRAELVSDNYFHAVLEAVKSIIDKLRHLTGLQLDGAELVDKALSGDAPIIKINSLKTPSEYSGRSGFANLLKGTYGMFRNPTAHEARINWDMSKEDAEDLLSLASLIHRRLDAVEVTN